MKRKNNTDNIVKIVVIIAVVFVVFKVLFHSISHEMGHAYIADAPMYWTVGRGMLNNISPYSGLYENKPPLIFIISAISFLLTEDTIFVIYFV